MFETILAVGRGVILIVEGVAGIISVF